jgi:phage repressor protein C with HTH and peptisase S24 domain
VQKLAEVEEAKELMTAAKEWSVWRWLIEKGRVRAAADRAVEALEQLEKKVKAAWNDDLRRAYRELETQAVFESNPKIRRHYEKTREEAKDVDAKIKTAVRRVKEADDEAARARIDAEETFDQAERKLSASMAREGAQKAIDSWELREKAIRRAEALLRKK